MTFAEIRALIAHPDNHAIQMWANFPLDEETEEAILAFFNKCETENPLKRFYSVDEELTEAEIDEMLKEPEFTDVDELDVIEVVADTDESELDEAIEEAVEDGVNVTELNEICQIIEDWDTDEQALFCAVHYEEGHWFSITDYSPRNYIFYPGRCKQEVAEDYLFDDMYPDFPDELKDYLDMDRWAEWEMDGYVETDWGTYYEC